ncbi:MAG TPA: YgiQ family radical SAM protein [Treponemataceae bacterium]|nr:YgiQ family radical SAM protein [Treponemataceae bacterium]
MAHRKKTDVPTYSKNEIGNIKDPIFLPSYQEVSARVPQSNTPTKEGKKAFAKSFNLQQANTDAMSAHILIEQSETRYVIQEPPAFPLSTKEFDAVMELPYTRRWHPIYDKPASNGTTGVPALKEVLFSLVSNRGCFGACSFCAITFHQGRRIQARSHESLIREAKQLTAHSDFKGYIHDVGGPTANFRQDACEKQIKMGACTDKDCLGTHPCPHVRVDHSDYIELLRKLRNIPGVKKVFIRSGIRFDYVMLDKNKTFLEELCKYHISGQLKVAPEHASDTVLNYMRKSTHATYTAFSAEYARTNKKLNMKQYLIPYYIASHPGSTLDDAIELALYLKKTHFIPDQVQDFYATPGSLSTAMYYSELDPRTMQPLYVAKGSRQRRLQRALAQFNRPENKKLVKEALIETGRQDLIKILT